MTQHHMFPSKKHSSTLYFHLDCVNALKKLLCFFKYFGYVKICGAQKSNVWSCFVHISSLKATILRVNPIYGPTTTNQNNYNIIILLVTYPVKFPYYWSIKNSSVIVGEFPSCGPSRCFVVSIVNRYVG